jgi:hypothetical protein
MKQMSFHTIPGAIGSDTFGVAPDDDAIGYTDAAQSKVGMLIPKIQNIPVTPIPDHRDGVPVTLLAVSNRAEVIRDQAFPHGSVVTGQVTRKQDGTWVEANVGLTGGHDSEGPLGISPNKGKGQGTFFYAVGFPGNETIERVGMVRLPMAEKARHPRDDDDAEDGWDHATHPDGWHTSDVNDADADGFEDAYDLPTANEQVTAPDPAPLAAGQSIDYPMTASSTSLALLAIAKCDPLAQLQVGIYNSLGMLVATSTSTAGVGVATVALPTAGNYKARVTNIGATPLTQTPLLVVREPWP